MLLARQSNGASDGDRQTCRKCGRFTDPYGRCSRRSCATGHFLLWAGDTRAWVQGNAAALAPDGRIDMLTLTAPGVHAGLTWDTSACTHAPGVKCSGKHGCRVTRAAAIAWNDTAPARLTQLLNSAHARVTRELRTSRPEWLGIWEEQERGVLHPHMLFAAKDRRYVKLLATALRELAPLHCYGAQVNFRPCGSKGESRGAAYLYKTVRYVTKSASSPTESAKLIGLLDGPLKGRPFMRASPKLTTRSKTTMRNLRYRRFLFMRARVRTELDVKAVDMIRRLDEDRARRRREEDAIVRGLRVAFEDPPPYFTVVERHPLGFSPEWRSLPGC